MSTVPLEVVTPERVVLNAEVQMVTLRGGGGDLGILPRHAPLATTVRPGVVKVRVAEGEDYLAVGGGFLHVMPDRITLLVDTAEIGSQVDVERAANARERAEKRLSERGAEVDVARVEAALMRARHRLQAAELSTRSGEALRQHMAKR